jgi:hypothetical protein
MSRDRPRPARRRWPTLALLAASMAWTSLRADDPPARPSPELVARIRVEVEKLGGRVERDGAVIVLERTATADADLARIAPMLREVPTLGQAHPEPDPGD